MFTSIGAIVLAAVTAVLPAQLAHRSLPPASCTVMPEGSFCLQKTGADGQPYLHLKSGSIDGVIVLDSGRHAMVEAVGCSGGVTCTYDNLKLPLSELVCTIFLDLTPSPSAAPGPSTIFTSPPRSYGPVCLK
jgi:hypothetical protein